MDNNAAEVTSYGSTGPWPDNRKTRLVGDGCQLNRRHCKLAT